MVPPPVTVRISGKNTVDMLLAQQLLWMLFLRVLLYTFLLGVSAYLQSSQLDVPVLPPNHLLFFILFVYLASIGSGLFLLRRSDLNAMRFGRYQNLLDILLVTFLIYCTGGSHSIFSPVFFFPIIAGGLIMPRNGGLFAAGASTILFGLILASEYYGYFPDFLDIPHYGERQDGIVLLNLFAVYGLIFFLIATLSSLFSRRLRKTEDALSTTSLNFDRLSLLYKQIFDDINTGIITTDDRGRVTSANNAASHITGYPLEDLLNNDLHDIFPAINLTDMKTQRHSANIRRKDGQQTRIGYSYAKLQHRAPETMKNRGEVENTCENCKVITLQDISEVERLEKQMQHAEKLAAIGRMSAGIAHDFRNPLTAISGSAQLLANDFSLNPTAQYRENSELINIIMRESSRLSNTVSDFLKFARPEHAEKDWFSLQRCLDEVIEVAMADPAWPKGITLERHTDDVVDIWADQYQLFTILNHLLQNALAFCAKGREVIRITAKEVRGDVEEASIEIDVEDNGPGVAEGGEERIFEPFYTKRVNGTGLGLAIARQMMDEHQGSIGVGRSSLGGAKFSLSFPLPE